MVRAVALLAALLFAGVAVPPVAAQNRQAAPATAAAPAPSSRDDSAQPVQINADNLDVQQDKQVAVFKGNVDATQGDLRLKCDMLRVIYSESPKGAGGTTIDRLEAFGNVFVSRPGQTGKGERGTYDLTTRIVVLEGNVVLTDKGNVLKGERATMDLNGRQSVVERGANSRVQGVFQPKPNDGKQ
jgi:lipopolysaccharide export system protein LptA